MQKKKKTPEKLPKEVVLWGVEAAVTEEYGTELSPKVAKALVEIKQGLFKELGLPVGQNL